jgi:hypothetical protein
MKTIFRLSLVMAVAVMFIWVGVAEPGELVLEGTNYEYLVAMDTGTLPGTLIKPFALKAATDVVAPEPGTWEYSVAMETGNLPSACGDVPCGEEIFIVEFGGIPFRMPIDVGP